MALGIWARKAAQARKGGAQADWLSVVYHPDQSFLFDQIEEDDITTAETNVVDMVGGRHLQDVTS
jgi:hypothetical protein